MTLKKLKDAIKQGEWCAAHWHPYVFCKRFGLEVHDWMTYDDQRIEVSLVTIVAGERCYLRGWFSNN